MPVSALGFLGGPACRDAVEATSVLIVALAVGVALAEAAAPTGLGAGRRWRSGSFGQLLRRQPQERGPGRTRNGGT